MNKFSECVNRVTPVTCAEGENAKDWKFNFVKDEKNLAANKESDNVFLLLGDSNGNVMFVKFYLFKKIGQFDTIFQSQEYSTSCY